MSVTVIKWAQVPPLLSNLCKHWLSTEWLSLQGQRVYDVHLSTAVSVVNFRQRKPASPPQPHHGCAPSLCRLSAARKQRRRSGRESRLSADGWSGRVLGAGIPQLLSTRLLQLGRPCSWSDPLHSVLRDERRQLLSRLQPSHRVATFEQLRIWGRLRFWCVWLWRVCFLKEYVYLIRRAPSRGNVN